jgi:hypothetical protein
VTLRRSASEAKGLLFYLRPFFVAVGGVIGAGFAGWRLSSDIETEFRWAGMLLQLFALGIGIRSLIGLRKRFGLAPILPETWRRFKLVFVKPPPLVLRAGAISLGMRAAPATLTLTYDNLPLHKRIALLEADVKDIRKRLELVKTNLTRDLETARNEINARLREQGERTTQLERRFKDSQIGDWWLEAVGLFWLVLGGIVGSVPSSAITALFHR